MMLSVAVSFLSGDLKSGANSGAKSARDLCSTGSCWSITTKQLDNLLLPAIDQVLRGAIWTSRGINRIGSVL